jgi:hypothetical protein
VTGVQVISLDGIWRFQLADHPEQDIAVPGAWEDSIDDWLTDGPARYTRMVHLPAGASRYLFEADAVSFACTLFINGAEAGGHRGMWTRLAIDITRFVRPGEDNAIELRVWKPGARYPLRECMAGFLPDVANTFGGIWQPCRILCFGDTPNETDWRKGISSRSAGGYAFSPDHSQLARHPAGVSNPVSAHQRGWRPQPDDNGARLRVLGDALWLDGAPAHLRGVLDWGWQPDRMCPTPAAAALHETFARYRELGFNLVKLCLFVPNDVWFDAAEAAGMLLWLELPLWLPVITPESRALILSETEGVLRRLSQRPDIVLLSLGCELDHNVDAALLTELRGLARRWMPHALLIGNSGSGEAYGGLDTESDVNDYHFYCDPPFFQPLLDHFARAYRRKPWVFGEYCDADTLRDFHALSPEPRWLRGPTTCTRDELRQMQEHKTRLAAAGITDGGAALTRLARKQALLTRKQVIETTRRNFPSGGYVITHARDNPLTASGMLDDFGAHKFDPDAFRRFNAERVLLIDRPRRRVWQHGGDRPVTLDPAVFWADEAVELRVLLSNGGPALPNTHTRCELAGESLAQWTHATLNAASVNELGVLSLPPSTHTRPVQRTLSARMGETRNQWPLLWIPRITPAESIAQTFDARLVARAAAGEHVAVWLREPDPAFCTSCPFVREVIHVLNWDPLDGIDIRSYLSSVATDFALDPDRLAALLDVPVASVTPLWRRFDARTMTWLAYVLRVPIGAGSLTISTLRHAGGLGAQPAGLDANPLGSWLLARLHAQQSANP